MFWGPSMSPTQRHTGQRDQAQTQSTESAFGASLWNTNGHPSTTIYLTKTSKMKTNRRKKELRGNIVACKKKKVKNTEISSER